MSGSIHNDRAPLVIPPPRPTRFARVDDLADRDALSALFGSVRDLEREPMGTVGHSGSRHERLVLRLATGESLRLVHKRTDLNQDWTAYRTRDLRGRESALLSEPEFSAVWDVFDCPYVAFAREDAEVGLLMWDLSPQLLPDQRVPIDLAVEDAVLGRIAELHARFWESSVRAREWLTHVGDLVTVLGPGTGVGDPRRPPAPALNARVQAGWALAIPRLLAHRAALVRRAIGGGAPRSRSTDEASRRRRTSPAPPESTSYR